MRTEGKADALARFEGTKLVLDRCLIGDTSFFFKRERKKWNTFKSLQF